MSFALHADCVNQGLQNLLGETPYSLTRNCWCRGGIPLIFPQYGRASGVAAYAGVGNGKVPTNGFLNHLHWTLVDAGGSDPETNPDPSPTVVLETQSTVDTYALWPFHFRASYTVSLTPPPLLCEAASLARCTQIYRLDDTGIMCAWHHITCAWHQQVCCDACEGLMLVKAVTAGRRW